MHVRRSEKFPPHFFFFLFFFKKRPQNAWTFPASEWTENCLHKFPASPSYLVFRDHWSQSTQSKPVLKLRQSFCRTRCCIFNAVLAGGTHQIFVSLPVKQPQCLPWRNDSVAPLSPVPSRKSRPGAERISQTSAVTESHWWRSTIHQAPRMKKSPGRRLNS